MGLEYLMTSKYSCFSKTIFQSSRDPGDWPELHSVGRGRAGGCCLMICSVAGPDSGAAMTAAEHVSLAAGLLLSPIETSSWPDVSLEHQPQTLLAHLYSAEYILHMFLFCLFSRVFWSLNCAFQQASWMCLSPMPKDSSILWFLTGKPLWESSEMVLKWCRSCFYLGIKFVCNFQNENSPVPGSNVGGIKLQRRQCIFSVLHLTGTFSQRFRAWH